LKNKKLNENENENVVNYENENDSNWNIYFKKDCFLDFKIYYNV
jgi:hypothetical protein